VAFQKVVGIALAAGQLHRLGELRALHALRLLRVAVIDHPVEELAQVGQLVVPTELEALAEAAGGDCRGEARVLACSEHETSRQKQCDEEGDEERDCGGTYEPHAEGVDERACLLDCLGRLSGLVLGDQVGVCDQSLEDRLDPFGCGLLSVEVSGEESRAVVLEIALPVLLNSRERFLGRSAFGGCVLLTLGLAERLLHSGDERSGDDGLKLPAPWRGLDERVFERGVLETLE
jgi:hypothetical protein